MANSNKISRRNFMQQSAMWAAAFAGAGSLVPGVAQAARGAPLTAALASPGERPPLAEARAAAFASCGRRG